MLERARPVDLGSLYFPTTTLARGYFKKLLDRYSDGCLIRKENEEFQVLLALFSRRPDFKKFRNKIRYFFVGKDRYNDLDFFVFLVGGKEVAVRYNECLKEGGEPSLLNKFQLACRYAIREYQKAAKVSYFRKFENEKGLYLCEVSKEWVRAEDLEADHYNPRFAEIVDSFIAGLKLELDLKLLRKLKDGQYKLRSSELSSKFAFYHYKVAKLRMVKRSINRDLSLPKPPPDYKPQRPLVLPHPGFVTLPVELGGEAPKHKFRPQPLSLCRQPIRIPTPPLLHTPFLCNENRE